MEEEEEEEEEEKTQGLGEKAGPVLFCPPQNQHELTQVRTRVSAVTGRRLTA
jgi:hypothetical protein